MNCTDIQKYVDDYLDDSMSPDEKKAVDTHVEQCKHCQQLLTDSNTIRQALRALPIEDASADFEANVFTAVRSQHTKKQSDKRFLAGFSTAIAASLALWFASTVMTPQIDGESQLVAKMAAEPQIINLAMSQARTVKLVFDAPTDLTNVTLSVQLPDNVELDGYSGQKQLVWQTNLTRGQNILALPVIAIGSGQGELVAQLNYGDKTKQFHIVLKTDGDGALIYQINNFKTA